MPGTTLWPLIHAQRAALADDLEGLDEAAWAAPTLCPDWTVREVVAHLTAAASTGRWAWLRSMVGARFDPAVHNRRRLAEHLGTDPADTLARFRAVVTSTTAASGHLPAWLGEVVVHAQDVRHPLGIATSPPVQALMPVAEFFAARDFAVPSRSTVAGLRLEATDSGFVAGEGALVRGSTLALVMSMAGRAAYHDGLDGPGVATLRERSSESAPGEGG